MLMIYKKKKKKSYNGDSYVVDLQKESDTCGMKIPYLPILFWLGIGLYQAKRYHCPCLVWINGSQISSS